MTCRTTRPTTALLLIILGLTAGHLLAAGDIAGKWLGIAGKPENRSVLGLEIKRDAQGALIGLLTLEQLNYYGVQVPEFVDAGDRRFKIPAMGIELILDGDRLTGTISGGEAPVELQRSDRLPVDAPVPDDLSPAPNPRWQTKCGSAIYATTAVRDGIAFVGSIGGVFHAINTTDGSLVWTFGAGRPIFGEASTDADAVYFVCDNGWLFKLARDSGKEVWRYDLGDAQVSRIPPHPRVYDYDYQAPRPTLADGVIYVGSGDGSFHAVNADDGHRIWRVATKGKIRTDAAVVGAHVVFTTTDGLIVMAERATGRTVWQKESKAPVTSSPVMIGGRLIVGGRDSQLQALQPDSGDQLWRVGFWGSWVEATPTVAGEHFYLGSSDLRRVGRYDPANGRIVWRTDVFGWAWGRPLVTEKYVFVGTAGVKPYDIRHVAALTALDRTTGKMLWRRPMPEPAGEFVWGFAGSPALSGDTLVIGGLDGTLYGFPIEL